MGAASTLPNVPAHSDSLRCHDGLGRARSTYVRRRPEDTVLHQVVGEYLARDPRCLFVVVFVLVIV
jgi:hypothetical protein